MEPNGDGKVQYCPHCGAAKEIKAPASFCKRCGRRVVWVGPLWGSK